MRDFWENLKRQAKENPVMTFIVVSACTTALSKLLGEVAHWRGSNAYARDVNRRVKQSRR